MTKILPGCAPPRDLIFSAVQALLEGKLPPKGSVLSPNKSECDECDRNDSKPEIKQAETADLLNPTERQVRNLRDKA